MRIAILGGGITGLTLGSRLEERGIEFDLYEKEASLGGLCRSKVVGEYIYDVSGGHVFNSKHHDVVKWIFSRLPKEKWKYSIRNAFIQYGTQRIPYPFEFSLGRLPMEDEISCIIDFLKPKGRKPNNYHDWITWMFGTSIATKYMHPYNEKIWQFPLRDMAIDWVDGKMPLPSGEEVLRAALSQESRENKMPHSSYYYPLKGGIATLVQAITPTHGLRAGEPVRRLERMRGKWKVNGEGLYEQIVWTLPLPLVPEIIGVPVSVGLAARALKWNSLTTFLYREEKPVDGSWTYFHERKYPFHRIVNQGGLSPFACPDGKGSQTVEITGRHRPEKLDKVFPRENLLGHNYTEFAYALFDKGHARHSACVRNYLGRNGIVPLGRFGEWQYYNMDICMKRAFECADMLLHQHGR